MGRREGGEKKIRPERVKARGRGREKERFAHKQKVIRL